MRTQSEIFDILGELPIFSDLGDNILEGLASVAIEEYYQPGQIIIEEGTSGRSMYVIISGEVEVYKGSGEDETVLAKRGYGDIVGEMSLFEGSPRFASIRVLEETDVIKFMEPDLQTLWERRPEMLYHVVSVLSSRLREADLQLIADLNQKNRELEQAYRELQIAQAAQIEIERLVRELELAHEIQRSMLPTEFPKIQGLDIAAWYCPARQVGGDFYDVIRLGSGRIGLVMADVSDKGMPAALFMALTRSLIRAEAQRSDSPRATLMNINKLLLEISQADMFVTVFYGLLDLAAGVLRYSRAGHDKPLLINPVSNECRCLGGRGSALGIITDINLDELEVEMHIGEYLLLYTDGVVDAVSRDGEVFGIDRLIETVCSCGDQNTSKTCSGVFDTVQQFTTGHPQFDDMALLMVSMDVD